MVAADGRRHGLIMAGEGSIAKRLRMTLDFEVEVAQITDESLREHYRHSSNYEELVGDAELWANLGRQVRLQRALLEDEEALRQFITFVVADEVDASTNSLLGEVFGVGGERSEEDILGPVFRRLSAEDARYLREASEVGELFESIEVLSRSFKVRWTAARLEEVTVVAKGTPASAVSDNLM